MKIRGLYIRIVTFRTPMSPAETLKELADVLTQKDPEKLSYWDFSDEKKKQFILLYKGKRKDPQELMILTAVGFLGFAGIQRFMTDEVGMGILYLLTWGLCGIGTIIDLVNNKKMAFEFNQKQAYEVINMTNMMNR